MHNQQFLVVIMTLFSLMTASAASSYVVEGERDTARILRNSKNKIVKKTKKGKSMKQSKKGGVVTSTPPPLILSKSDPFAISYSPLTSTPTNEDYEQLTGVTSNYLEDYFMEFFDKTALTNLDSFLTVRDIEQGEPDKPGRVFYNSTGLFSPDSTSIPSTRSIDGLIPPAFGSGDYLALIKALPASNPFRETEPSFC